MTKIPLRQMIDSGSWFRCEGEGFASVKRSFRMRVKSFRPIDTSEIESPHKITGFTLAEGRLWLLSLTVVNLDTEGFSPYDVKSSFVIVDQDNCVFKSSHDTYLECVSTFSVKTGLRRFSGTAPHLAPKMVAEGAAVYLLPDEDSPQYFLQMKQTGTIAEI